MPNAATGVRIQIETPLDFLVVADHADYHAIPYRLFTTEDESLRQTGFGQRLVELWDSGQTRQAALELVGTVNNLEPYEPFVTEEVRRTALGPTDRDGGCRERARQVHCVHRLGMDLVPQCLEPAPGAVHAPGCQHGKPVPAVHRARQQ